MRKDSISLNYLATVLFGQLLQPFARSLLHLLEQPQSLRLPITIRTSADGIDVRGHIRSGAFFVHFRKNIDRLLWLLDPRTRADGDAAPARFRHQPSPLFSLSWMRFNANGTT